MATTQITLSQAESEGLRQLEQVTGKPQDQLLHEAVQQFLSQSRRQDRLLLLQRGRGIWKDRQDLPPLEALRSEWDRS